MTPAEQIAWHRSEADRIEAEERARRPALAQGQIWEWIGEDCTYITCATEIPGKVRLSNLLDGNRLGDGHGFCGIAPERFRFVGLARDVLRVVPPDPPAPQAAPEPTGAELVGRRCWVRHEFNPEWQDRIVQKYDPAEAYCYGTYLGSPPYDRGSLVWWKEAKPYVEGVAP